MNMLFLPRQPQKNIAPNRSIFKQHARSIQRQLDIGARLIQQVYWLGAPLVYGYAHLEFQGNPRVQPLMTTTVCR